MERIPSHYLFAITAAYAVPFLLYRTWARRKTSPFLLLWPGLIAMHALLALAGVRFFKNEMSGLTFLWPILGYGAIAGLVSHLYSRVALHKLRNLVRTMDSEHPGGRPNA